MIASLTLAWIPEALLQPMVFCATLAAGMGLCGYLFITLKAEIRALLRKSEQEHERVQALEAALAETRHSTESLTTELRGVQSQTGMLVAPSPARSGLNLSKRTHVLRMHRAGERTEEIALALALPRSEVDLLIKVHRIAMEKIA